MTTEEKINKEFHKWLRDREDWVKCVAQSDIVYQAMRMAYEAGKESEATNGRITRDLIDMVRSGGRGGDMDDWLGVEDNVNKHFVIKERESEEG